jgi:hypothetical protein
MALPANIGFGTVTGSFMEAVADTADAGREPDGVPMAGLSVAFTPSVSLLRNVSTHKFIAVRGVTATTDSTGTIVGPDGVAGVVLMATDDPDLDNVTWTWSAAVSGGGLSLSFSFALPVGGTLDLSTIVPVPGSAGETLSDAFVKASITDAVVAGTNVSIATGSDGRTIISSTGGYNPPEAGIAKTDLEATVQTSLTKADGSVQITGSQTITGTKTFSVSPAVPDASFVIAKVTGLQTALNAKQDTSAKGVANGYASLDSGGKVPSAQLGSTLMTYQGTWNASTNVPTLVDGTGTTGMVYRVATAGTRNLGSGSQVFSVGDDVLYNGTIWQGSGNPNAVASVAGKTGVVTLAKADVGLGSVDNTADTAKPVSTAQQTALDLKADDSAVVKVTGAQTVAGIKTFSSAPVVPANSFPISAVSGLQTSIDAVPELIRDTMGTALVGGTNVTITPNDAGDTITISSTGTGGGSVDLSGGLVGDGVTDNGPIMQAALAAGQETFILNRDDTYKFNTSVFLNSTDVYSKVVIIGNGAKILAGSGLYTTSAYSRDTTIKWVFFNNCKTSAVSGGVVTMDDSTRATGTTTGGLTRLYIQDLTFDGNTGRYGLSMGNRTSVHFKGVTLYRAYTLVSWTDYSDSNVLDHCQGRDAAGPSDSYLIHQIASGDGLIITSAKTDPTIGVAYLSKCNGAVIDGDVTGSIIVSQCSGITINGWHMEGRDMGTPGLSCRNSQVTLNAPVLYSRTTSPWPGVIQVDDNPLGADRPSDITINGGLATISALADDQNGPTIEFVSAITNTAVRAFGFKAQIISTAASTWFSGSGPRIKGTSTMLATIAANEHLLAGGTWEFARTKGAAWVLGTPGVTGLSVQRALANPAITSIGNASSPFTGTLTASTVYTYCYALKNSADQYTTATAETSVTTNAQRSTIALLTLNDYPAKVVVWRKTGTGVKSTPDAYAVLSVGDCRARLLDTGANVNGVPWITTSIPVPNTVAATNGTTSALYIDGVAV